MPASKHARGRAITAALAATIGGLLAAAAPAAAFEPVEGVWNYEGGAVLVEATAAGTFRGVVTRPTQFSSCTHAAGENMWQMRGSGERYLGTHNYFTNSGMCAAGGFSPGKAAWRVDMTNPAAPKLVFCSNTPADPLQPDFDAAGNPVNSTDGCATLTRLAPPGPPPVAAKVVSLPSARKCRSRRSFPIRFKAPGADPVKEATVLVNGRRVRVVRGADRLSAGVDLRGLPKGRYTVTIRMITVSGKTITGKRRYRTCVPKRR